MTDERYLWDRSGPPDPEVERLEGLLGGFRWRGLPCPAPRRGPRVWPWALLAAAGVAVLVWWAAPRAPGWRTAAGETLAVSRWLEARGTDARLFLAGVGEVRLEAGGRLQLRALERDRSVLFLERGTLRAGIRPEVPARFFRVETPAVSCVDVGCRYTLHVAADGDTKVFVERGEVAFEREDVPSARVPRGATCRAPREGRLGTPCFREGVTRDLPGLLARFDTAEGRRRVDLAAKIAGSVRRPRDTLALWHLLRDDHPDVRAVAEKALVRVAGVPPEARRQKAFGGIDAPVWLRHLRSLWW